MYKALQGLVVGRPELLTSGRIINDASLQCKDSLHLSPASPTVSCVAFDKYFDFPMLQFPYL